MDIQLLPQTFAEIKQICYNIDKRNCVFGEEKDNWGYLYVNANLTKT
jgi:hypothetical protein